MEAADCPTIPSNQNQKITVGVGVRCDVKVITINCKGRANRQVVVVKRALAEL